MFRPAFASALVSALAVAAAAAACQEPDQSYGDPSGIIGKKLPGETSTSSSGTDTSTTSSSGATAAPTPPTFTVAEAHADGGGPSEPINTDCLGCHGNGPTPKKFAFGGLVSNQKSAVVTVDGLQPVATDTDGYFWSEEANTVAAGATVTVSSSGSSQKMGQPLAATTGGGCLNTSGCHGATSPGPITL